MVQHGVFSCNTSGLVLELQSVTEGYENAGREKNLSRSRSEYSLSSRFTGLR